MKNILIATIAGTILLSSCVPQRKFAEMETKKNTCEKDLEAQKKSNELLEAGNKDLQNKVNAQEEPIPHSLARSIASSKHNTIKSTSSMKFSRRKVASYSHKQPVKTKNWLRS